MLEIFIPKLPVTYLLHALWRIRPSQNVSTFFGEFALVVVSVIIWFYRRGLSALCPTPSLEDHKIMLRLVSTHRLVQQRSCTPANRALGVMETCTPPLHDKVVIQVQGSFRPKYEAV